MFSIQRPTTVINSQRGCLLCVICGDTIPIPLGVCDWSVAVMRAFCKAHKSQNHSGGRTFFQATNPPIATT